ncbi:hypothetical protein [Chamaesiphon sp. OTE_20_metabat_361]|uniref:hypothetical protein n=1 Tax=Chamaesiphon sp. OTE_20_metabat_361 TaxID=2964689 RepID=UPI00286C0BE2|nr:hypothetical protein [Chamaesiphon sp. OTE_20_metabat_361]
MKNIHRYLYLIYVTIWLLNEYKYFRRIDYNAIVGKENYQLINELIIGNFLFGAIGLTISLLILSSRKTGIYFIFTCAIGLAIAAATLYLDATVTANAAQAHLNSVMALFVWLMPIVIAGWQGIIKDVGAAINKSRKDR